MYRFKVREPFRGINHPICCHQGATSRIDRVDSPGKLSDVMMPYMA